MRVFLTIVEMWKTFLVEKVEKNVEKWLFFEFLSRNPQSFPQVIHNLWITLRKPKIIILYKKNKKNKKNKEKWRK